MSLHDIVHASQPEGPHGPPPGPSKLPVRSWRKKYRKMRMRFEAQMNESNALFKDEHKALALARRLQEQNDQLLDLLLDINSSARLPPHQRIDLRSPSPSASAVPSLEPDDEADPTAIQHALSAARSQLTAGAMTPSDFAHLEATLTARLPPHQRPRTLTHLSTIPHTPYPPSRPLPDDLAAETPPGYFSPTHEDEYLSTLDSILDAHPSALDLDADPALVTRLLSRPAAASIPGDKDLQLRNPDSVYNWLRRNQPSVFLQDRDTKDLVSNIDAGSEKSGPAHTHKAPPAHRATKRGAPRDVTSTPQQKSEQEALDEEIGFVGEAAVGAGSAKRKKGEDDASYRPKGGNSRPAKRKREDGEKVGGRKKVARASGAGAGAGGAGGVGSPG
ncbi:hypothetical protein H2201_002277 [Coniosporium apollinis]|uniref:IEC3 subunit of the Ino80 complex, chromatin re-modelling-domain-containing protein n=1 Tax=Coniosporium apollinis TaxID=61459 RepID=A0ABQ9NZF4_9PEZI|nr:hypothetical protein H2201_002277 [Coniosporium apollinis]